MWMQQANRTEVEKVWVNFTNTDGQTVTAHYPVSKYLYTNASSVTIATNEAASRFAVHSYTGCEVGNFIGVAYEDVADGDIGVAQVYGYHESLLIAPSGVSGAVTIRAGQAMAPDVTTIGFNSLQAAFGGHVIALDTIGGGAATGNAAMLSAGVQAAGTGYADHVFIRAM